MPSYFFSFLFTFTRQLLTQSPFQGKWKYPDLIKYPCINTPSQMTAQGDIIIAYIIVSKTFCWVMALKKNSLALLTVGITKWHYWIKQCQWHWETVRKRQRWLNVFVSLWILHWQLFWALIGAWLSSMKRWIFLCCLLLIFPAVNSGYWPLVTRRDRPSLSSSHWNNL